MSDQAYIKTELAIFSGVESIGKQISSIDWENRHLYGDLLAQIFYYVDHATRVLAYAAVRTPVRDPELHNVFLKGISEEKNHEILAKNDLSQLGFNLKDFPERALTSCYYQTLYYNIDFHGPMALLGYFVPLEAVGPLKISPYLPLIRDYHGPKAASFLEEHCLLDQAHYKEGLEFLKTRSSADLDIVEKTARLSCEIFSKMLADLVLASSRAKKRLKSA